MATQRTIQNTARDTRDVLAGAVQSAATGVFGGAELLARSGSYLGKKIGANPVATDWIANQFANARGSVDALTRPYNQSIYSKVGQYMPLGPVAAKSVPALSKYGYRKFRNGMITRSRAPIRQTTETVAPAVKRKFPVHKEPKITYSPYDPGTRPLESTRRVLFKTALGESNPRDVYKVVLERHKNGLATKAELSRARRSLDAYLQNIKK